jgi:outer membrane protein OmpA-like peptidoglycan-associated protein
MKKTVSLICVVIFLIFSAFGCASWEGSSRQTKGTVIGTGAGAAVGAGLGAALGGNTRATLAGAGIGALVGGLLGNQAGAYMDRQQEELEALARYNDDLSIRRSEDVLHATFKSSAMFSDNSSSILPGSLPELQRVAQVLSNYPQTEVLVAGHTDARGNEISNQRLSESRANAVKNVLIQNGVDSRRIRAIGYGESMPISDDDAMNRRVELTLTPIAQQ